MSYYCDCLHRELTLWSTLTSVITYTTRAGMLYYYPTIPYLKESMKNVPMFIKKLAIYCEGGGVIKIVGDWTIEDLSYHFPICSRTGIDSLLYLVVEHERDNATVEFYDMNNRAIPDPRIYMEDLP